MAEMGGLDREELRTMLLDTKNMIQEIVPVYRGSLNASMIGVGELFKEAVRRNSVSLTVVHNDPKFSTELHPRPVLVFRIILDQNVPTHRLPQPPQ